MGTISNKIARLYSATSAIREAILSKGGTVLTSDGLEAFPQAISTIPTGGSGIEVADEDIEMLRSMVDGSYQESVVSFDVCKLRNNAFVNRSEIIEINFPYCFEIGEGAFESCTSLQSVSFPNCSTIGSYAFRGCTSLQSVSFPNCSIIGTYAFYLCQSLPSVNFPNCITIERRAFVGCFLLQSISFPNCSVIKIQAFRDCTSLQSVNFPNCNSIEGDAFYECTSLQSASFPNCSIIEEYAFEDCTSLQSVYLLSTSVCALGNSNAFANTPIASNTYIGTWGSIYVPSSLVTAYKTATNWTYYSSRITAMV